MRTRLEQRFPPYEGDEPYLHLCFSDADVPAVWPLLARLHERGVRLWYAVGVTARAEALRWRNERADHAALTVLYLTEAARQDTEVKDTVLFCQQQGLPLVCLDADAGDHELTVGLTGAVPHVEAWRMASAEEVEDALVHAQGFVQELIGPPPPPYQDPLKRVALALCSLALVAVVAGMAFAWQRGLVVAEAWRPGDTTTLSSPQLVGAARRAQGGGALSDEDLAHITTLRLAALPDDPAELARFSSLARLELPQSLAADAVAAGLLDGPYDLVLVGEGWGA